MNISKNPFYLVLDQGTSSSKIFLFNNDGDVVFSDRERHLLNRPKEHHVENNPIDILNVCTKLISSAINYSKTKNVQIQSMGMAVQRSTFLFWNKQSLKHYSQAISWQDSRAQKETDSFNKYSEKIKTITGVPLNAHFGAPKFLHLTKKDKSLREKCDSGSVWFGTLSAYLTHSFSGIPATDESIAGRSLLMNLNEITWDNELCSLFNIPKNCLPPIAPTIYDYGTIEINDVQIPLHCVIGDQQAALIGQGGTKPGTIAMNFGTSGSVQFNAGVEPKRVKGLLSNVLYSDYRDRNYLLEGTISSCSSLFFWLEKELNITHQQMQWDKRCKPTETNGVFIPSFAGIAAPYWCDGFKSVYYNLNNATDNEIIRAGMETIGFLVHDIYQAMVTKKHTRPKMITVSGGSAREPLLQFIADLLNIKIGHTSLKDRTALGVFKLLKNNEDNHFPEESVECDKIFIPKMDDSTRKTKLKNWRAALDKIL